MVSWKNLVRLGAGIAVGYIGMVLNRENSEYGLIFGSLSAGYTGIVLSSYYCSYIFRKKCDINITPDECVDSIFRFNLGKTLDSKMELNNG